MQKTSSSVLFAFLLALFLTVGLGSSALYAEAPTGGGTLTVTRNDDPAPDGCQVGDCSLREAIIQANGVSTPTQIVISTTGTITLSIPGADEDFSTTGDLDILGDIQIEGNGVTVNAAGIDRVFDITDGPDRPVAAPEGISVSLSDLTVTGGNVDINSDPTGSNVTGAGIRVRGGRTAAITNVAVVGNIGTGSTFGAGGGIGIELAFADISQTSIYSNTSDNGGGFAVLDGSALLTNVTVGANIATGQVAGVLNLANTAGITSSLMLDSVTIVNNVEQGGTGESGTGLDTTPLAGAAITTIGNSIIANNQGGVQCFEGGTITSADYNILGDDSCNLTATNDLLNTDPQLQPVIGAPSEGGVVQYFYAPGAASPAIDSGDTDSEFDQIGTPRPQDLAGFPNATDGSDRGAIEQLELPTAVTLGTWTVSGNAQAWWPWTIAGLLGVAGLIALAKRRQ